MAPETTFALLGFVLVTVPVVLGAVVFLNRDRDDADERIADLERRVEELESERE